MDYRIEERGYQRCIAIVRAFSNEIINDEENQEIPDFWGECNEKNLVEPLLNLRPVGKKDLYGLCSPAKEESKTFNYGIGIIVDQDTEIKDEKALYEAGYETWEMDSCTYAVFKCIGNDGDCIGSTWSRFYKEFLPQTGYESTDATDYELYFEKGEPGLFCELWIPIKKK